MASTGPAARFMKMAKALDEIAWEDFARLDVVQQWHERNPEMDNRRDFLRAWVKWEMKTSSGTLVCTPQEIIDTPIGSGVRDRTHKIWWKIGEARRALPQALRELMAKTIPGYDPPRKVEVSWIVAYCERKYPNNYKPGWEKLGLFHRCGEMWVARYLPDLGSGQRVGACIDEKCLHWERQYDFALRGADHYHCWFQCYCGCHDTLCGCNGWHNPPCL